MNLSCVIPVDPSRKTLRIKTRKNYKIGHYDIDNDNLTINFMLRRKTTKNPWENDMEKITILHIACISKLKCFASLFQFQKNTCVIISIIPNFLNYKTKKKRENHIFLIIKRKHVLLKTLCFTNFNFELLKKSFNLEIINAH